MFTSKGSPRSPRPDYRNDDLSVGMKDNLIRSSETLPGSDPSIGKRVMVGENKSNSKTTLNFELKHDHTKLSACKGGNVSKRHSYLGKHMRTILFIIIVMSFLFSLDSLMVSFFDYMNRQHGFSSRKSSSLKDNENGHGHNKKSEVQIYGRLLNLAMSSLAEKESEWEKSDFWKEQHRQASTWKPCADRKTGKTLGGSYKSNGYILVSANGGLNQQRVAICNSVAVASLLNATLVLPRFLYSNVWKDPSQFADIYQEEYFMKVLKAEVHIVKEIPSNFKSIDVEAIGSLITDADLVKEAKPVDYIGTVLPLLLRNRVVHFLGFGNRLGFDPLPCDVQRLRCKCNFHALKFVPKIQQVGSLLVSRIRKKQGEKSLLDEQLYGNFIDNISEKKKKVVQNPRRYLALHLRFEVDMVAYSLCEFGGGEYERKELQAYRETHFPLLVERLKNSKHLSPEELRKSGRCPLTPGEAGLVLAGLNFNRQTYIYLAGSEIYGGSSRLKPFSDLYPNLVTKETLLTPIELAPFRNFSSQLAALDFLACASADVFAMTDSGSQLSSLVSGFRTYYGGGKAPTLSPNKKILASILTNSSTLEWTSFKERVNKMIRGGQRVHARRLGHSIYRQPRCLECMCKNSKLQSNDTVA